jgi:hypothetical protein
VTAPQPGEIAVEDQLERRLRKPADFAALCLVLFRDRRAGGSRHRGQRDHVRRADRPGGREPPVAAVVVVASPVALFALLILPVAMAVQLLVRRQFRRLGEAVATGVLAAGVTAVVNEALTRPAASRLYYAIIMARPGTSHAAALDPYLAGLVAYATMVGLAGRPYWRNALWAAIAVYAIVHVGALHTSVLTLLITVIAGRAIGLAVRYVAGSASQRPRALDIAGALGAAGLPVTAIRRVRCHRSRQETHRATTRSPPRETAAGWTWPCMTGTSRRPAPSTGCIGGCGCSGRCHAAHRCRWTARSGAGPCCLTRPRTRARPRRGCAP